MKQFYSILVLSLWSAISFAQTDSMFIRNLLSKPSMIADSRHELITSFLLDDQAGTALWMDSLTVLEDEIYAGLIWDERWLLHFWTGSYGTLLEEVTIFDENKRAQQSWKIQPKHDSLFEWVDYTMNEKRFEIYSSIQSAFLNQEEKAFTTLLIDYLLRQTGTEENWAERIQAFEDHYPSSRFGAFLRSIKPEILKPTNRAFGISGGLLVGNWRGNLERSLNAPYAFQFDTYYWSDRWNILFDGAFGGPSLARDILIDGDWWPKEDPTSFFTFGLNLGYDVINTSKIRVFPSFGGGVGFLKPPTPGENEDPLPDYYDKFNFTEFHLAAALTADVKLFSKNYQDWNMPKGSYHGIRIKLGWNGLNLGKQNEDLQGALLYLAVHYNIFAFMSKHSF